MRHTPRPLSSLLVSAVLVTCSAVVPASAQPAVQPAPEAAHASDIAQEVLLEGLAARWHGTADGGAFRELEAAAKVGLSGSQPDLAATENAVLLEAVVTRQPRYVAALKQRASALGAQGDRLRPSDAAFLARAGVALQQRALLDQAAAVLLRIDQKGRDLQTGLLLQPGSGTTSQQTALQTSAADDAPWSRDALYALHLSNTLDAIPLGFPQRGDLIEALNKTVVAISTRAAQQGGWAEGGARRFASRGLFAYVVYHGVRLGWLAGSDQALADAALAGVPETADHTSAPLLAGALLLAQTEHLQRDTAFQGKGITVTVDAWFNAATRASLGGGPELFLYKWTDETDTGFSFFGRAFQAYGAELSQLTSAPTRQNLAGSQVYLIVSPPLPATNPGTHAMDKGSSDEVEAWVRGGGVLVLMLNDPTHTDFSANQLAERFHLHFNPVDLQTVNGPPWEAGRVETKAGNGIFQQGQTAFLSNSSSLSVGAPAVTVLTGENKVALVAATTYGRGTVLAVANPWFVNRTTDGRLLPPEFVNDALAKQLAAWLIAQAR